MGKVVEEDAEGATLIFWQMSAMKERYANHLDLSSALRHARRPMWPFTGHYRCNVEVEEGADKVAPFWPTFDGRLSGSLKKIPHTGLLMRWLHQHLFRMASFVFVDSITDSPLSISVSSHLNLCNQSQTTTD